MSTSSVITKSGAVALDSAIRRATVRCRRVELLVGRPRRGRPRRRGWACAPPPSARGLFRLSSGASPLRGGLDVGLDDPPARAGALDAGEVEPELARHPPRDRRRLHAPVARPRAPSARASSSRLLLASARLGLFVGSSSSSSSSGSSSSASRSSSSSGSSSPSSASLVVSSSSSRTTAAALADPRDRLADRRACRPPWPRSRACRTRRPRRSCWPCPSRSRRAPRPWRPRRRRT